MARDPLAVLRRLREAAVTEARRNLAAALASEMQQARQLDEHRRQIRHEQSEATGEHVVAFGEWLPYARQRSDQMQAALASEQVRVGQLQQILVGRRTEAEAVAKAMQRQREAAGLIQARKEQAVMDEAAGRRGGGHGAG
jgi:flagellar export protein FliJ